MSTKRILPPEYEAFPTTLDDKRWMDLIANELHGWPNHSGTKHLGIVTGPEGRFRSLGFNGLPKGLDDGNPAFSQHPLKREMTLCAERNALRNLRLIGLSAKGCTLHADAVPCAACAGEIVDSGIVEVVMVDAEVHSHTHGDDHWRTGLQILLDNGIRIRRHDPVEHPEYAVATQKIYHLPIASGSVDWDSRFLSLARYLEAWTPGAGGTGAVVARRPSRPPTAAAVDDKIVRALGCASPGNALDVFEVARVSGVSLVGCALYLSNAARLPAARTIIEHGIAGLILPDTEQGSANPETMLKDLRMAGIAVEFHKETPQDYASLVKAQHPGHPIGFGRMIEGGANVELRNEGTNHVV